MSQQVYLEDYYKGKVILITGGAGAIGSFLSKKLANLGAKKVIIFDNLSSAYEWNIPDYPNVTFVKGDIRNENDLIRVFHYKPQIIFHLAAFFANQNSVNYPLINVEVNTIGLIKILEYATLSGGVERFIFTNSEGGAYGDNSKLPYKEEDISIELGSPYYISKIGGEAYCRYYHKHYGLPISIVRLFNSYGPGEVPGEYRNVIPNFIYWSLNKQSLPLTGDERMARDFVFIEDTVNGILKAGFHNQAIGEAVNIATGNPINIYQLAETINKLTNNPSGIKIIGSRKWDKRPVITGDTTKAKKLITFEAETDFKKGIELTINWFKCNWDNIIQSAEFSPGKSSALDVMD